MSDMSDRAKLQRAVDALSIVQMCLEQHTAGPEVRLMKIAGNGPTLGEVIDRALRQQEKT
jgi:hypothetical protein